MRERGTEVGTETQRPVDEREGFGRESEGLGRKRSVLWKVNLAVFPVKLM